MSNASWKTNVGCVASDIQQLKDQGRQLVSLLCTRAVLTQRLYQHCPYIISDVCGALAALRDRRKTSQLHGIDKLLCHAIQNNHSCVETTA